jgi:hypothetical protein
MNYSKVLLKFFGECSWSCGKTYESLKWNDTETPKPTKEDLEGLWNDVLKDEMRKERNKLLKESDFRVLPDSPNTNKEAWVLYRQQLRDLPETWSEGTPFPIPHE